MKRTMIALSFFPFLSFAQVTPPIMDLDWKLQVSAQGSLNTGEKFDSFGVATFTGLDTLLASGGGYNKLYRQFKAQNNLTYGVWQEATAFQDYLKNCGIDAPVNLIAMRMGITQIFATQNDQEVTNILSELGEKLSFDQKVEFASRIGHVLSGIYDYGRAGGGPNGDGIVTFRDMIAAKQNGGKAGVCRDMAVAIAQSLKQMGVDGAYVVAFQTAGGGHATVLVQDPTNAGKTYNINYDFVTSTESASASSHLRQDSYHPSVGTDMRIYTADGKPAAVLPTHLGVALEEIIGRRARDLDPMLQSESQVGRAEYRLGKDTSIAAGAALTPDGDKVIAVTTTYADDDSEHFPMRLSVALYHNERDTNMRGDLATNGLYFSATQYLVSDPVKVRAGNGTVSTNLEGRILVNSNVSQTSLDRKKPEAIGMSYDLSAQAGVRTRYDNDADTISVDASVFATGGLGKANVRDEGVYSFDLRDVRASAEVTAKLSQNLNGFASSSVIARTSGLGIQANQEVGVSRFNSNGTVTSAVIGTYGPVLGDAPVFVPGSRRSAYAELRQESDRYSLSGGGFCQKTSDERTDCGVRATATLKLGGRRQ